MAIPPQCQSKKVDVKVIKITMLIKQNLNDCDITIEKP